MTRVFIAAVDDERDGIGCVAARGAMIVVAEVLGGARHAAWAGSEAWRRDEAGDDNGISGKRSNESACLFSSLLSYSFFGFFFCSFSELSRAFQFRRATKRRESGGEKSIGAGRKLSPLSRSRRDERRKKWTSRSETAERRRPGRRRKSTIEIRPRKKEKQKQWQAPRSIHPLLLAAAAAMLSPCQQQRHRRRWCSPRRWRRSWWEEGAEAGLAAAAAAAAAGEEEEQALLPRPRPRPPLPPPSPTPRTAPWPCSATTSFRRPWTRAPLGGSRSTPGAGASRWSGGAIEGVKGKGKEVKVSRW